MINFKFFRLILRALIPLYLRQKLLNNKVTILSDDIFIVGYPKSGNTWLDMQLACLRAANCNEINFDTMQNYVSDIYFGNSRFFKSLKRPRFFKSHEAYNSSYPKVLYIVTDPRSVAISYYHFLIGNGSLKNKYPLKKYINRFICGNLDGYGSWGDHVRGWLSARNKNPEKVMVIKYEDMLENNFEILRKIAAFFNLPFDRVKTNKSINWTSVDNMRLLELQARNSNSPTLAKLKNKSFVRKANSVSWSEELNESLCREIEIKWGDIMRELNYL